MAYTKLNLVTGDVLTQARMAHLETQYELAVRAAIGLSIALATWLLMARVESVSLAMRLLVGA